VLGRKDFDCDIAVERKLVREVYGPHSPTSQSPLDSVLETDCLLEDFEKGIHRGIRRGCFNASATRQAKPRLRRQGGVTFTALHQGHAITHTRQCYYGGMNLLLIFVLSLFQIDQWEKANREVVRLAPSSFSQLPKNVMQELERRNCTIPQVWGSHPPGNVISGEFLKKGQKDWAVLCSVRLKSWILVLPSGSPQTAFKVAEEEDLNMLEGIGDGKIGYSREIGPVGEAFIRDHYEAYGGTKPPPIDHLGIEDAFNEKGSVVHYYYQNKWLQLTGSD